MTALRRRAARQTYAAAAFSLAWALWVVLDPEISRYVRAGAVLGAAATCWCAGYVTGGEWMARLHRSRP